MEAVVAVDIDGTLTPIKSSWSYLHHVLGTRERSRSYMRLFFDGLISYEEWVYLDLGLWKGLSYDVFRSILSSIPWRAGVEDLRRVVERWRGRAIFIAVTAGFAELGERAVRELGFDTFVGTEVEVVGGRLSGRPRRFIDIDGKGRALMELLETLQAPRGIPVVSVGDSFVDEPLFRISTVSIAFCAEHDLRADIRVGCDMRRLARVLDRVLEEVTRSSPRP